MIIEFTKMSGAGNDFILIDNRYTIITDGPQFARRVCDRRWGIGADGLLLLEKSEKASYKMMYYNADGSYGGMCGNGGRCIALYATSSNIAFQNHTFEALDYIYKAQVNHEHVRLSMKNPTDIKPYLQLPLKKKTIQAHYINTGSPHVVIFQEALGKKSLEKIPLKTLGKEVRFHKKFQPEGTNVNFISVDEKNRVHIRTYERGVEAETLACGTGSVAAGIMAYLIMEVSPPVKVITKSGFELGVEFNKESETITDIVLEGPAKIIFKGVIEAI